jgi:hypothetical protein
MNGTLRQIILKVTVEAVGLWDERSLLLSTSKSGKSIARLVEAKLAKWLFIDPL